MKVGVIGGGAAGLAAAFELLRQGHSVEVFERAPFLGGQASTFDVGGGRLERGYHHLFTSDTDMVWLIHELGLGPKLAWIPSKVGLYHSGRIWPFATPKDLLRFSAISLVDRIRLGLVTLALRRRRDWRSLENATAAEWLSRWVGRRAYQAVWEPLLRGKFGRYYDQIGMTWFWGKIALRLASRGRSLGGERLGYPMGSFGEVFDTLGERVRAMGGAVHTSAEVARVLVEEGRAVGLEVQLPGEQAEVRRYDAVLSTTPSRIFADLAPELPESYRESLTSTTYLAAVLIVLELDRSLTPVYWLNIADRSIPFVAAIEHTNFVPPEHYGGSHLLYLSNYLDREDRLYSMPHDDLLAEYVPHLKRLNPAFDDSWIKNSYYHRENAAQPVNRTGYAAGIPSHRTPIPALYLANTTQIYPEDRGTNYSVRIGRKVARLLLSDYGHPVTGELPEAVIKDSATSA